jgi:hypothetical protein
MEYHELRYTTPPVWLERDGKPHEQGQGHYVPRRIRFIGVEIMEGEELFACMHDLAPDHSSRLLSDVLHWRSPSGGDRFLFILRDENLPALYLKARRCALEERVGAPEEIAYTRDWSPTPHAAPRLVPDTKWIYRRYGGDPIEINLNGRTQRWRLFIGGVTIQGEQRPKVDAILNVGEEASRWTSNDPSHAGDRWATKGEGSEGMDSADLAEEARWVIERLEAGQRVLVHCVGGMNRSTSICCAVLILLEGLTAEAALERVRVHHPWGRPDATHWLALRWLAHTTRG